MTRAVQTQASIDHSTLLDNWRGWAIIAVLLGHFFEVRGINLGRFGVELFFVLSGLLMADLLFIKETRLPRFFYRRFTRVVPVSLLFLCTMLIVFPAGANHLQPTTALAAAAMVINYTQLVGVGNAMVDHYWSLCVEEHSYLLLGLLAWLMRRQDAPSARQAGIVCLGVAALMVLNGWRLEYPHSDYYTVYWRSDVRAASIFMSAGLRALFMGGVLTGLRARWLPIAAVLLGAALNTNHVPDPIKYSLGTLLIALAINTLEQARPAVRRLLSLRVVAWFGLVSYSVYIWQQPFYYSIERYGVMPMLLGALATAATVSYLYEQPLRAWLNTFGPQRRAMSPGAVVSRTPELVPSETAQSGSRAAP